MSAGLKKKQTSDWMIVPNYNPHSNNPPLSPQSNTPLVPDNRKNDIEAAEERRDRASRAMEKYHQSIARAYNQSVQHRKFKKGDLVWKTVDAVKRGQPIPKFSPRWEGPYKVVEASSNWYYKLTRVDDRFITGSINAKYVRIFSLIYFEKSCKFLC
ncbi:hypothetical protein CsSME_00016455 [Camellia sinensis var. sinensis]